MKVKLFYSLLPIILVVIAGFMFSIYLNHIEYTEGRQYQTTGRISRIQNYISDSQEVNGRLVTLLQNKWAVVDNVATHSLDLLIDEIQPFHEALDYDLVNIYEPSGELLARADKPALFGVKDKLSAYVKGILNSEKIEKLVVSYEGRIMLANASRIDSNYESVGVIVVGHFITPDVLSRLYPDASAAIELVLDNKTLISSAAKIDDKPTEGWEQTEVFFPSRHIGASQFSAKLFEDVSTARQDYWSSIVILSLFFVFGGAVIIGISKKLVLLNSELERIRRENAEKDLQESERYNRMLFETSPVGLALCRMDGELVDINSAFVRIIGRGIEETKQLSYWDITPDEYAEDERRQLESLKATGRYGPYEKEYIHKDGHRVPVRLLGQIIERDNEQYIWSSTEDITEKKNAEQALQRSHEELEEQVRQRTQEYKAAKDEADRANQAKSQFLSNMSHELRTPLNAILGFAQLLELSVIDEGNKNKVQQVLKAGNHLLALVNEILDLSKIETGKLSVSLEDVQLNPVMDECFTLIKPLAAKREIHINDHISCGTQYTIRADYTRFKQGLLNLLSNAVKYNRDKGSITLSCETVSPNRLRISVSDTGMGLSEEQQARLFKPFERIGAETTGVEGAGIGLVISKQLMELMGGDIGFRSQQGQGTTFWLEINLVQERIKIS